MRGQGAVAECFEGALSDGAARERGGQEEDDASAPGRMPRVSRRGDHRRDIPGTGRGGGQGSTAGDGIERRVVSDGGGHHRLVRRQQRRSNKQPAVDARPGLPQLHFEL